MTGSSRRVAIIDDEECVLRAARRFLEASGMETSTYASAEAFLASPDRSSMDCLVVDVNLGGMSGFDLQREIAGSGTPTPVVFMSAYGNPESTERALAAGAVAFLTKPVESAELLAAVRKATAGD